MTKTLVDKWTGAHKSAANNCAFIAGGIVIGCGPSAYFWFYVFIGLSAVSFIASVISKWHFKRRVIRYLQTVCLLLIVPFVGCGRPLSDTLQERLDVASEKIGSLKSDVNRLDAENEQLAAENLKLKTALADCQANSEPTQVLPEPCAEDAFSTIEIKFSGDQMHSLVRPSAASKSSVIKVLREAISVEDVPDPPEELPCPPDHNHGGKR